MRVSRGPPALSLDPGCRAGPGRGPPHALNVDLPRLDRPCAPVQASRSALQPPACRPLTGVTLVLRGTGVPQSL